MTKSDGKYPNKEDFEPKVPGAASSDELPLADPSDSNTSDIFRKNALEIVGEHSQSAFGANKPDASYNIPKPGECFPYGDKKEYDRQFNQLSHDKWNELKPNQDPFKP